jgi:hypothetical protein
LAAILGLKNYPADSMNNTCGYDKTGRKVPVLLGFSLPAFKLLDVVALEAEWYDCRYPNSYQKVAVGLDGLPLPAGLARNRSAGDYRNDPWRWSVYPSKTITRVSFISQFARDISRSFST